MKTLRHAIRHSSRHALGALAATAAIALVGAFASPAFAAGASPAAASGSAGARYMKDRADCDAGKTAEDRATCLKEAGAAEAERKRHQLDTVAPTAQNATDRCNLLPAKDKADCIARVQGAGAANQTVTKSGSVAGGGIIKETKTTTTGPAIVIPAPVVPPASATH